MDHLHARNLSHDKQFTRVPAAEETRLGDILIVKFIELFIIICAFH